MSMNNTLIAALVAAPIAAAGTGFAGYKIGENMSSEVRETREAGELASLNDGYATVIASRPLTETYTINEPRQECRKVPVHETVKQEAPYGGKATYTVGGAIVGGLIGNQFGDGRGKDIGTAAGAILGGSIGYDQAKRREKKTVVTRYVDKCKTVNHARTATRNNGYEVTYQYAGQIYTTRMSEAPAARFPVQTQVMPATQPAGVVYINGAAAQGA